MKFSVQVTRTIVTHIEVDAPDSADARRQVKEYGPQEAVSDYKVIREAVALSVGWAVPL